MTHDTEFPLPSDIMGSSLQAPCPGFPSCACHIGFLCYFAQNSRLSEGKQVFNINHTGQTVWAQGIAEEWDLRCSLDLSSQVPLTVIPRAALLGVCWPCWVSARDTAAATVTQLLVKVFPGILHVSYIFSCCNFKYLV